MDCELRYGAGFYLFPFLVIGTVVLSYSLKRRLKQHLLKRHLNQHIGFLLALVFIVPAVWLPEVLGLCGLNFVVATYIISLGAVTAWAWHRPPSRETEDSAAPE